jgi:hypothetical protein
VSVTEVTGVEDVKPMKAVPVTAGVTTDPDDPFTVRSTVSVPAPA